ncbi:MAG: hypothetical protein JST76_01595 [Bacteroidetes bacterium]|nr:hypothetical protein [Bacteroidota bacterium]
MNLNYGYDKDALKALVATADTTLEEHNVVIDFDGEVIIDPEKQFPNVPVAAYKFAAVVTDKVLRSGIMINAMYDSLEDIFFKLSRTTDYDDQLGMAA